eukprot:10568178-Alexandrium_andersonii.AAC.1
MTGRSAFHRSTSFQTLPDPSRRAAGPQSRPECATAAPTAQARVTGQRGQPEMPKSGPMPAGSQ